MRNVVVASGRVLILFAFGLAVLFGQLLRRTIPAMLAALVLWVAIRIVVEFLLRPHFMAPLPFSYTCSGTAGAIPSSTCHRLPGTLGSCSSAPVAVAAKAPTSPPAGSGEFQAIEAGIFVAFTLLVLGTAVWLLHRRAV